MPRVKTIRPGRLTGITGLTQQASRQIGRQKDIEYATALSDWQAEKTKLEGIKQDKLNYLDQKMKMIAGEEQAGGATFDEGFKKAQMEQAKEYANIVSDIKLGNIDAADGYAKLAVFDQSLKNIETAIPNINAFNKKMQEAMNKEEGEVGSFIYDGSGKTFEIAQLFNDMYSPNKSGNVSTVIEDGKTFLVHKDGQKISIEGLNAIMSGENPDYPINFVQDPTDDLKAVHDAMMKKNDSRFKIEYNTEDLDSEGRKITTKEEKYYIGDNSNYMTYLNRAVEPILNDNEKMKSYWPTIGEGVWTNSDDQRQLAQKALAQKGKNLFAPKNDVISKDIDLPESQTTKTSDKEEESTVDTDGFNATPTGYVDRTNADIYGTLVMQSKTDTNVPNKLKGVTTINESAMGSILDRELSSIKGYNVDSYEFVKDKSGNTNLVIKSVTPSGGKIYSKDQIEQLNNLAFKASNGDVTTVIGQDGTIVDQENFDALQLAETLGSNKDIFVPKGGSKKKESKEFVVKKLNTPNGVYELEKLLITNRFTTAKEKQQALNKADKIRIDENKKILSGERQAVDAQKIRSNLKAIKNDFITVQNYKNPVVLNSPRGSFQTNAVNWFKSLPKDYKVRTPDGIVTAEEFLSKDSYPMNFLYETYTYTFEDATKNPQPGISLNYEPMNISENSEGELD